RHHFDSAEGATKEGQRVHHSSEVNGGAVTAAGEQTADDGLLRKVTDMSGHYMPDGEMIYNYVDGLKQDGAKTLDDSLVAIDADGKMRQATPDEAQRYQRVQKELPALEKELLALQEKERKLKSASEAAHAEDLEGLKAIGQQIGAIAQKVTDLKEVRDQLRKDGVGPRNKDATVEVFQPGTRFSPEEWEKVKGDKGKIQQAIINKLGMKLGKGEIFPEKLAIGPV